MRERWKKYEEEFLLDVSTSMTAAEIGEKLDRSNSSIFNKASRMGVKLTSKTECRAWDKQEEQMASTLPARKVAELTGRSIFSVRAKRYKLSLLEVA